ncbi:MAG: hypothetical protein K9N35_06960 [Candidatus Marinimicrobia bacterium]|nr:hypothetical protein [Candidatus Neomarinimicrobiota bacterium]
MKEVETKGPHSFTYTRHKNGTVFIQHHEKNGCTLRGSKALAFTTRIDGLTPEQQQHFMARLTGNYKHGNEKLGNDKK